MKALIAMSGGVDSSVAAKLTLDAGYECIGCTMKLFSNETVGENDVKTCCSLSDVEDAGKVCYKLGIEHYTVNFEDEFRDIVIGNFISTYRSGETPNPCIECNRSMKFGKLWQKARQLGCDTIVTGHYARIVYAENNYHLLKAADPSKDQSYVLYNLTQELLEHVSFPLGEMEKSDTRRIAEEAGLLNAHKRESQDICFVPDGDYASAVERFGGFVSVPGDYIDKSGKILGKHKGVIHYTIGQHKHLGIIQDTPLYVTAIDVENNTVTLGPESELYSEECRVRDVNWVSGIVPDKPLACGVKSRYRQKEQSAVVIPEDSSSAVIRFDQPQRALTCGQSAVFYIGDEVIGGGIITK